MNSLKIRLRTGPAGLVLTPLTVVLIAALVTFPFLQPRRGIVDVPRVEDVDPTRKAQCGHQLVAHTACTCPHGAEYQRLFGDALCKSIVNRIDIGNITSSPSSPRTSSEVMGISYVVS